MADPLPKFDAPPVIETVLSVQFAPLPEFTGAMAGWFWREYLSKSGNDWAKTHDTVPIQDQFERFEADAGWAAPGLQLVGTEATRTQIIRADDERMIQIQFSRFVLNWKRATGQYPSYDRLLPEFQALLEKFVQFTQAAGYAPLAFNQWEVTYVNHIYRGELWSSFDDVKKIFTDIGVPASVSPVHSGDALNAGWRYRIGDNAGRLYVNFGHAKVPPDNKEAIRLQFTARGPLNSGDAGELKRSLDTGHEAIVRTFAAITTSEAHKFWKRTQ